MNGMLRRGQGMAIGYSLMVKEDWFSLVDAEREKDLLGRPIPQHLECKNIQTPISIICQFSSNGSIKLSPERVDCKLD
jgi:hypothetical protein